MLFNHVPAASTLDPRDIHLYRIELSGNEERIGQVKALLSDDEKKRAVRFVRQSDRDAFILSHGCLRTILSRYLDKEAHDLVFETNEHGKPHLAQLQRTADIHFNLSHSGGLALVGICLNDEIGVDIERIRSLSNMEGMARKVFSAREQQEFQSLPEGIKPEGFFNAWTRKEALIKAWGRGFRHPLQSFSVALNPEAVGETSVPDVVLEDESAWRVYSFLAAPGYFAAVATPIENPRISAWDAP